MNFKQSDKDEEIVLDFLQNFSLKSIPSDINFWMIRTKKGYFYDEFISNGYVALAWNIITSQTSFENESALSDNIIMNYPIIKRPKLVINKCKCFINEVKQGDIFVIPNKGSTLVTFAIAGEYYEEEKSVELENTIIEKIEKNVVMINDVYCPYRKRRCIQVIRTVKSESMNYHLYRALTSYHGISSLNSYSTIILDHIYNYYEFNNVIHFVFNVTKKDDIGLNELSRMLYGTTTSLSFVVPPEKIKAKLQLQSAGDIVISISDAYNFLTQNYLQIFALVILIGGGSFLTVKFPGVLNVVKQILSIKTSHEYEKEKLEGLRLENYQKKLELYNNLKDSGIDLLELETSLCLLDQSTKSMEITAAIPKDEIQPVLPEVSQETDENDEI